jgi:hypothetical protein
MTRRPWISFPGIASFLSPTESPSACRAGWNGGSPVSMVTVPPSSCARRYSGYQKARMLHLLSPSGMMIERPSSWPLTPRRRRGHG